MKIENLERASQINDELAKLKLAKNTLNNGGYVRIYSSARARAGGGAIRAPKASKIVTSRVVWRPRPSFWLMAAV